MDLDLLDGLPPPTISLTSNRSWSMTKFIDFPEDVLSGEDDHHRSQVDSSYLPGEPRYLSVAPISRGILIHDSGEYVQPQDVWASSFSNRFGSADSPYYHISTDSFSNAGTTPSPASTTGNMFLSSDAHLGTEDSGPSSMTSPNSDGSDSSGHSVYSVSTSERHNASLPGLSVPSFSPSLPAQPGSHSPLSIYSSISSPPLVLSATSSPSHAPYPLLPDRMPSPLQLAPQDAGTTVNMSDVYSHPSTFDDHAHDIYALTLGHSFSDFDEHRSQTYSSPLNPSILLEADVESEFGKMLIVSAVREGRVVVEMQRH
ncbi:hypothetical protein L218DRAFT_301332 [Marasmius fiardii PR-910]|nr:hypothetical protein L218DRAFT_301332 [Marasmius fiardii PR-910]